MAKSSVILDRFGRAISSNIANKKLAFGQYSSIYEWPNAGRFRQRVYVNQDTELGVNFLVRDLLCRWSREMYSQMPFLNAGIRTLALFSVGDCYMPQYCGTNSAWGEQATSWLKEIFYPQACKRGRNYDFQTMMFISSLSLDTDGDFLTLHVFDERSSMPRIQVIPSHRINSGMARNAQDVVVPTLLGGDTVKQGPLPNTIISDGVIYDNQGEPIAYNVVNSSNMVNSMLGIKDSQIYSARDAYLQYDPIYFDRGRGLPSISSGILQALSLQEIQSYMVEKIKIESMIALIERTPEGVGPYEEAQAYQNFLASTSNNSTTGNTTPPTNNLSANLLSGFFGNTNTATAGLRVVNDPSIRYISVDGDIKTLSSNTPADQTTNYISNLEAQVLQTIGIPHALLFSHDNIGGRISDGVIDTMNASIKHRQELLDKCGKFILAWAVAKGVQSGDLPANDEESLYNVFEFTHPPLPNLNKGYDRAADLSDYNAGIKSLNDLTIKTGKTAEQVIGERTTEAVAFFTAVKDISNKTGADQSLVAQYLKENLKQQTKQITEGDSEATAEKE